MSDRESMTLKDGARVQHPVFGEGTVKHAGTTISRVLFDRDPITAVLGCGEVTVHSGMQRACWNAQMKVVKP